MTTKSSWRISATVAAPADVAFLDETRREAEEGMNRLAADIDGGETGRREDDHAILISIAESFEQRRFSGAGAAGDEEIARTALP